MNQNTHTGNYIKCYTDGSITENPGGTIGIGVLILKTGATKKSEPTILQEIHDEFDAHPKNTNNVAEYVALNTCLQWLLENGMQDEKIVCHSDSQMMVNQVNGEMRINEISEYEKYDKYSKQVRHIRKENNYYQFAVKSKELLKNFSHIKFYWLPREQNKEADKLSKVK